MVVPFLHIPIWRLFLFQYGLLNLWWPFLLHYGGHYYSTMAAILIPLWRPLLFHYGGHSYSNMVAILIPIWRLFLFHYGLLNLCWPFLLHYGGHYYSNMATILIPIWWPFQFPMAAIWTYVCLGDHALVDLACIGHFNPKNITVR